MRKRILKYSIWIVVLLFGVGLYSLNADYLAIYIIFAGIGVAGSSGGYDFLPVIR